MTFLENIDTDMLLISMMATIAIREILIITLPSRIISLESWRNRKQHKQ